MSEQNRLLELSFVTDHDPIRKSTEVPSASSGAYGDRPPPLQLPHWKDGSRRNHPVSYTHSTRPVVSLKLSLAEPGRFSVEGVAPNRKLHFAGEFQGGTSHTAFLRLMAKQPLPAHVDRFSESLEWTLVDRHGKRHRLAQSGPHEFFVLWGKPITHNSDDRTNALTYKRLCLLTSAKVAGGKADLDAVVMAVHQATDQVFSAQQRASDSLRTLLVSNLDNLWTTLDAWESAGGAVGQCGEAAALMEVMLRLLGIPAVAKHVYACADRAVLAREGNTSYRLGGKLHEAFVTSRFCEMHNRTEQLWMDFRTRRDVPFLQFGEGCCWVESTGTLYPKLVGGKVVGKAQGGRSAVHDLLLKLQSHQDKFLVWATGEVPCPLGPFLKVPN